MRWPRLVAPMARSTGVSIVADADGIDEDGAPVEGARFEGMANWQDSVVEVYGQQRSETEVRAIVYIDGDAFPDMAVIAGGEVAALGEVRSIVAGAKARNVDGTVNHTRLELR